MLNSVKKYSVVCGFVLSCILILTSIIFYLVDPSNLNKNNSYKLFFYLFIMIFPLVFALNKYSHFDNFKSYFTILFLSQAISIFFHMIFVFIIYRLIDENLFEEYVNINAENFSDSKDNFFSNNLHYNKDYRQDLIDSFNFKNQLNSYIFSLLPCIVYSALISLLLKITKKT